MSETSVRLLKQLIRSLCPFDFQYFCHLCLKDQGYRCTPGPIPGRDGGHDIYGNGVHGTFVAHCTTTTTNLRRKMIRDLCASVSQCVDHAAPKQYLLFISTEPLRLTPPEKQTFIENDVIPQLVAIEPRYLDKAPGVETLSADELGSVDIEAGVFPWSWHHRGPETGQGRPAMSRRHTLTDAQWNQIKDLLPGKAGDPGRTAADNRLFVDAILFVAKTGVPWRDLPERFGKWNSIWRRFDRWCERNVWKRLAQELGESDLAELQLDSTSVKVHVAGVGGRRQAGEKKKMPTSGAVSAGLAEA